MGLPELYWLPHAEDFDARIRDLKQSKASSSDLVAGLVNLANRRLDFLQTTRLDRIFQKRLAEIEQSDAAPARIKLALLASGTVDHLLPAIRVAGLRRRLSVECYVAPYGQYAQELLNPASELHGFAPDAVLMSVDVAAAVPQLPLELDRGQVEAEIATRIAELRELWRLAREDLRAIVIQQTVLNRALPIFGQFESRVPAASGALVRRFNLALTEAAAADNALLLDLDWCAGQIGINRLGDEMLWHHAKQEVSPAMAPLVGDLLGRQLAAIRGLSQKCLVLDLDNTLWGGVLGDDGLEGIVLGQGSALGEAYLAFQRYAKRLSERGIVLAVSSKNDARTVEEAFQRHPEMALGLSDFAAMEVNWEDKPSALQRIAESLNLGLNALVFFDDNPAERTLMRETLPDVAVPEVPDSPEHYARCLADAGYFEAVSFTADDQRRTQQYVANRERKKLEAKATDMKGFLSGLDMEARIGPFSQLDLARITQLINKTNQFNLTTRRYNETETEAMTTDPSVATVCTRLKDRFGDNGIISVAIARLDESADEPVMEIDSWLMSCRVLGRKVENVVLDELVRQARDRGAVALRGEYIPTARNELVRQHYAELGFAPLTTPEQSNGHSRWVMQLDDYRPQNLEFFKVVRADD
ncbi:MAG: HAD-IIIC family phosphatase [Alphaproteobacteria bacterium]|nr:HAD-IIIC family phosphatase [Alphaproteobacteria bacterium]